MTMSEAEPLEVAPINIPADGINAICIPSKESTFNKVLSRIQVVSCIPDTREGENVALRDNDFVDERVAEIHEINQEIKRSVEHKEFIHPYTVSRNRELRLLKQLERQAIRLITKGRTTADGVYGDSEVVFDGLWRIR